jgi:hypothetical protein
MPEVHALEPMRFSSTHASEESNTGEVPVRPEVFRISSTSSSVNGCTSLRFILKVVDISGKQN